MILKPIHLTETERGMLDGLSEHKTSMWDAACLHGILLSLEGKGLVRRAPSSANPERGGWRLTSRGSQYRISQRKREEPQRSHATFWQDQAGNTYLVAMCATDTATGKRVVVAQEATREMFGSHEQREDGSWYEGPVRHKGTTIHRTVTVPLDRWLVEFDKIPQEER